MASKVLSQPQLDTDNLKEIVDALKQVHFPNHKWFPLGLQLGLLSPTLKDIEANHKDDVRRCLQECLTLWLSKADKTLSVQDPLTISQDLQYHDEQCLRTRHSKAMPIYYSFHGKDLLKIIELRYQGPSESQSTIVQKPVPKPRTKVPRIGSISITQVSQIQFEHEISQESSDDDRKCVYTKGSKKYKLEHKKNQEHQKQRPMIII